MEILGLAFSVENESNKKDKIIFKNVLKRLIK